MTETRPPDTATSDHTGIVAALPRRRWWRIVLVSILTLLVGAELTARWGYGLGDPPLFMAHPEIEYLYQPSQTHYRFGNRVTTNAWSMRSDEFPTSKSDPRELRILVLGDSVANGGAFTDQDDVATVILQRRLSESLKRPVVVGNASAGSWGPPNLLAYVKTFGLFDADIVIVIVGSEDYGDAPTFAPLGSSMPQRSPVLALEEAAIRYLPQLLQYNGIVEAPPSNPGPKEVAVSMNALRELLDLIDASGAKSAVALHAERTEVVNSIYKSGADIIRGVAASRHTPIILLSEAYIKCFRQNVEPYRDWIHPNAAGQAAMAESLFLWIMSEL